MTNTDKKISANEVARRIMTANPDAEFNHVVELIRQGLIERDPTSADKYTTGYARAYYKWGINHGCPGTYAYKYASGADKFGGSGEARRERYLQAQAERVAKAAAKREEKAKAKDEMIAIKAAAKAAKAQAPAKVQVGPVETKAKAKVKPQKAPNGSLKDKPVSKDKTAEELADIKAKNLARLKKVAQKVA